MEIASLKNNEQLLLDITYGYTEKYDHRQVPEGAPNTYIDDYVGDIPSLIVGRQIAKNMQALLDGVSLEQSDGEALHYRPQVPEYAPMSLTWILYVAIGLVLIGALLLITSVSRKAKKKKRRKRPTLKL